MSRTGRWRRKIAGLLALIVLAPLAARADLITFNPTGGGAGGGAISGIQNFTYAPGNVLAQDVILPGGVNKENTPFNIFYQSALASVSGSGSTLAGSGAGGNFNGSGTEFTVVSGFQERITGVSPLPAGGNTAVPSQSDAANISFSLASPPTLSTGATPNFFRIYAEPQGTSNTPGGTGFANGTVILEGHLIPGGVSPFSGSFKELGTIGGPNGFTPDTSANFNQSGGSSPLVGTTKSITGGGGTNLTVQVDSFNPAYFPNFPSAAGLLSLSFQTTNTLPFTNVTPTDTFFNGTGPVTATPGATNGFSGPDLLFQTVASNSFTVVPEPSTIIPSLTAATVIPSFLMLFKRLRRAKPLVA